jgi:hypothetical protein
MTKSWIALRPWIALLIIVVGLIWFVSRLKNEEPTQLYPATINRDCAPWDGMAFTVSIPWSEAVSIDISIYQSPQILHPVTFSFPDETLRDGNALLLLPVGSPESLSGKVFFERVEPGRIVEGRFDLISAWGEKFKGKFRAEWGSQVVYCG